MCTMAFPQYFHLLICVCEGGDLTLRLQFDDDESLATVFVGRRTYRTPRLLTEHVVRWTSKNSRERCVY